MTALKNSILVSFIYNFLSFYNSSDTTVFDSNNFQLVGFCNLPYLFHCFAIRQKSRCQKLQKNHLYVQISTLLELQWSPLRSTNYLHILMHKYRNFTINAE